jgi:ribosomal protein L29
MAILRAKDVAKMDKKEREDKLKDLRLELTKANVTSQKTNAKTKEIKRAIARLITFSKSVKGGVEKDK